MIMDELKLLESGRIFPKRLAPLSEEEIRSGWKERDGRPLVSVCCATFNHAKWIEDAICGFLAQKTDFAFEIIVRDDASIDGTTDIVLDYASRYPNIIRPIVNEFNQYSIGIAPAKAWPLVARGKYIALCEGDDFWIVTDKLQKQCDLMRLNADAVMSVALTHCFIDNGGILQYQQTTTAPEHSLIDFDDLSYRYFHTSTFFIRLDAYSEVIKNYWRKGVFDDTALIACLITLGPFVALSEVVSVYRITGRGVYSSRKLASQLEWAYKIAQYLFDVLPAQYKRNQLVQMYSVSVRLSKLHFHDFNWCQVLLWSTRLAVLFTRRALGLVSRRFRLKIS